MSETAPDAGYHEAPGQRVDALPSLYAELYRSRDYGDARLGPGDARLREIGAYWTGQLENEYRSPRAKKEIDCLLGRISFELIMRQRDYLERQDERITPAK